LNYATMPGKKLEKKKQKQAVKTRKKRTIYFSVGLGVLLVIIIGVYYGLNYTASGSQSITAYIGEPISQSFYSTLYSLSQNTYGGPLANMAQVFAANNGTEWTSGGKPIVVFIGAEYCPFCAATRWPLILALMRFGNFSGLDYMVSAPPVNETYYDVPTFTFLHAQYTSPYIVFEAYEVQNRNYGLIAEPPSNYSQVWSSYGSAYPFIDFANRFVLYSSPIVPQTWHNYNWTQIAGFIASNTSIGVQIREYANAITAVICEVDGNSPSSVCSHQPIPQLEGELGAAQSPLSESFVAGYTSAATVMWTTVQYTQIAWTRKTSVNIR
jgi:thiol-disulfide isomerase/thioredoxin